MAIIQSVEEQLARLGSYNKIVNYNRVQWRYQLESYLGGDDYRRGNHLTRYQLETDKEYTARLSATPLENHCKAVVNVYNSFLFRHPPERDLGTLSLIPTTEQFVNDVDFEGRDLDSFMKEVATWSSVFGHCIIMVCKPNIGAATLADEQQQNIRPYLILLTPLTVLDWHHERQPNGSYALTYLKYVEEVNGSQQVLKEWHTDRIETWVVDFDNKAIMNHKVETNGLGLIPAVVAYNSRSSVRGVGISDIADIADLQKFIYNMTSEVEQTQRMDAHPTLVKTPETQAGTGAGSIISMPENLDPGLKPFLLEYNGASVDSLYKSIEHASQAIDQLANIGAIRSTTARAMSGVAMTVEFNLLSAKLAEKADNIELAETQMWHLYALYMAQDWTGCVEYEDSFSINDEQQEYANLQMARQAATSPQALRVIDQLLVDLITDDTEYDGQVEIMPLQGTPEPLPEAVLKPLDLINTAE